MKVVLLSLLLLCLLSVTVLISSAFASSFVVSLPATAYGFVQVEVPEFGGITMSGQTISVDFMFRTSAEFALRGPVLSELILQSGPHSGENDYPYNQYVVVASGTSAYLIDESGSPLDVPMADGRGGIITGRAPTVGVISTPRGWAGADMVAYTSQGQSVGGVHFDIVLPNTGETLHSGRIAMKFDDLEPAESRVNFSPSTPVTWEPSPAPVVTQPIVWQVPTAPVVPVAPPPVVSEPIVWQVPTAPVAPVAPPPVVSEPIVWQVPTAPVVEPAPAAPPPVVSEPIVWEPPPPVVQPAPAPEPVVSQPVVWEPPPVEPVAPAAPPSASPPTTITWQLTSAATEGPSTTPFSFGNLGGVARTTDGAGPMLTGYARIHVDAGASMPSAVSILGYRQGGALISETVVPDSPLLISGRIYVEVSPGGDVNTAVAIVNPNAQDVTISFQLTDIDGNIFQAGAFTLKSAGTPCAGGTLCSQLTAFIDQYPFSSGWNGYGTLTFTSSAPVSVSALRRFYNERSPREFITTPLKLVDLSATSPQRTQVIPYFSAGSGMTTQLILVNPESAPLWGTIQFVGPSGVPTDVLINGAPGNSTVYSVAANSSRKFVVSALSQNLESGSVWLRPAGGEATPVSQAILSYKPGPFTIYETSVSPAMGGAFRMYAEFSPMAAVSVANATGVAGEVVFSLTGFDGAPLATSRPLALPPSGQTLRFLNDLFPSLAGATFRGVLRVTTDLSIISVVGLRGRVNDRQPISDVLFAGIPATLEYGYAGSADRYFPQIANGDGFTTEFILFSGVSGQSSEGSIEFFGPDGTPMSLPVR